MISVFVTVLLALRLETFVAQKVSSADPEHALVNVHRVHDIRTHEVRSVFRQESKIRQVLSIFVK